MRTRLLFIVFLGKIQYIYGHFERYRKTEAGNRKKSSPTITESYFFTSETIHSANLQPGKRLKIAWNPDRQCTIEYQGNSTFSVIESFNTQINKGDSFQVEHFYLHQPLILTNLCRRITPTSFSEPINYAIGYQTGLTSIQLLE